MFERQLDIDHVLEVRALYSQFIFQFHYFIVSLLSKLYFVSVLSSSFTNFKKFRTMLQDSSVELLSLITYLPSFTLFTGFLLNKELNTNCFSLPLNL